METAFETLLEKLEKKRLGRVEQLRLSCTKSMELVNKIKLKEIEESIEIVKQTAEEYNNGWIPCSERLPKVEINPVTNDYVRYNVTYKNGDMSDVRCYAYGEASGGKHWLNGGKIMDEYVIAWQPLPEPYQPKGE